MLGNGRRGARRFYAVTVAVSLLVGITARSALETPSFVQALKKKEKADKAGCREVETRTRSTCYRNITTKEPYACSATNGQEICPSALAGGAGNAYTGDLLRSGAAGCPRTRLERQCRSVAGTCYRRERQLREYPCPGREICSIVPTEVERTCVRKTITKDAYPCEKQKFDRICTEVQVPVDKVCHREESRTVQYPCKKTEVQRVCRSVDAQVLNGETCTRTVVRTEEYACMKSEMRKTCSEEPVEIQTTCTRVVPRVRRYACTRRVILQRCRNGQIRRPPMCSKTIKVQQPYECGGRQQAPECTGTAEPKCKDKKCKMRRLHSASCHKASLGRSRTCYREVDQVQEYPCATGAADGCELVEEDVPDMCTETASSQETYPCTKTDYREKCEEAPVEVPATCQREVPVEESYPCPVTKSEKMVCEHKPVEIEDTCEKEISVQVPYSCPETETKSQCKNARVTYQATCYKTVPKIEEYPCMKTELKRVCKQETKTCSERVVTEVPYECSRNVCEHVQVPVDGACNTRGTDATRSGCSTAGQETPRTCFRDVVAKKSFPCYKTKVTKVC